VQEPGAILAMLYYDTLGCTYAYGGNLMATSASATDQGGQPLDAPFLRHQRAEPERVIRQQAQEQAERLAARLRELGIEPDQVI
jgi:hypothetical protein